MSRGKKKVNTFKGYQDEKQNRRIELINAYLQTMKKSKIDAPHITALAAMVADHISRAEGGECSTSTLLRNMRYKALLLTYMAERVRAGTIQLGKSAKESPIAKAMIMASELDALNYGNEIRRLKAYIKDIEDRLQALDTGKNKIGGDVDTSKSEMEKKLNDYIFKYAASCKIISILLASDSLKLNAVRNDQTKTIDDPAKKRNNVIVDAQHCAPYFEWLEKNKTVSGV